MRAVASSLAVLALPSLAHAHAADLGKPPEELLRTFTLDPLVVVPAALGLALYARGLARLRRSGRRSRGLALRGAALALALLVVVGSICTPLDALGAALFSAHMAQHLLLVAVAAPLAALARPGPVFAWALSSSLRRAVARALRAVHPLVRLASLLAHPAVALALHASAVWLWHLPVLYEAALLDDGVHALEHASFFLTAWLFWRAVVLAGRRGELGHGAAVLAAFGATLQGSSLGAVLTSARAPWYRAHAGGPEAFGLTLLEDQQLAGLAMWVPGGVVYLFAALLSFSAWLRASEARAHALARAGGIS